MNISIQLTVLYCTLVVQSIFYIYVARDLGPQSFGEYTLVNTIVLLTVVTTASGLKEYLLKIAAKKPGSSYYILYTACKPIVFAIGIASFLVIAATFYFINATYMSILIPLLFSGITSALGKLLDPAIYAHNRGTQLSYISILANILSVFLFFCLRLKISPVQSLAYSTFSLEIILFVFKEYIFFKILRRSKINIPSRSLVNNISFHQLRKYCYHASQIFIKSVRLSFSAICVSSYMYIDRIFIGIMLTSADLAAYAVAVRVCDLLFLPSTTFISNHSPLLISDFKNLFKSTTVDVTKNVELQSLLRKNFLLALVVMLAAITFGPFLLNSLLGQSYSTSSILLVLLLPSVIIVAMGNSSYVLLLATKKSKTISSRSFAGAISNLALTPLLLNSMGIYGAAFATIISYLISIAYPYLLARDHEFSKLYRQSLFPF